MNKTEKKELVLFNESENKLLKQMLNEKKALNLNSFKHGIYTNCLLDQEEETIFQLIFWDYITDPQKISKRELDTVQMIALGTVKFGRAMKANNINAAYQLDKMIRRQKKDLARIKKEEKSSTFFENAGGKVSAIQFVSSFLSKVDQKEITEGG